MPGHLPLHTSLLFSLYQNYNPRYSGGKFKNVPKYISDKKKQDKRCRKKIKSWEISWWWIEREDCLRGILQTKSVPSPKQRLLPTFWIFISCLCVFSCICICIFICICISFVSVFVFVSSRQRVLPSLIRNCNFEFSISFHDAFIHKILMIDDDADDDHWW